MTIEVFGLSHVGMKRDHNEDTYLVAPDERVFIVADGMGGHASGEVASKMAVDELVAFFKVTAADHEATWPYRMDRSRNYDENRLATAVKLANLRIFEKASTDHNCRGMGTTLVSVHFAETTAIVAHVGDSRGYCWRQGALKQLTEDHSLLNDYVRAKKLSPEEIEAFPHKNVITRALGMNATVEVDVSRVDPQDGDVFLLCSDGLSGMVRDSAIEKILGGTTDLRLACGQLIDSANAGGGIDNVTCVLARWSSPPKRESQ